MHVCMYIYSVCMCARRSKLNSCCPIMLALDLDQFPVLKINRSKHNTHIFCTFTRTPAQFIRTCTINHPGAYNLQQLFGAIGIFVSPVSELARLP